MNSKNPNLNNSRNAQGPYRPMASRMLKPMSAMYLLALLVMTATSQADLLSVMVSPTGTDQAPSNTTAEPLYGTMTGLIGNQFDLSSEPGIPFNSGAATGPTTITYAVTFSSHPTWGDISFDLTLTPTADNGTPGLMYNGGASRFWSVDTGNDSTQETGLSISENQDENRIRGGETLSFEISNLVSAGNVVTFAGFTGLGISQAGSFDPGSGTFTGTNAGDTGGRVNNLQFDININAIPEPSSMALLVVGLGAVMHYRRHRPFASV